MYAKVKHNEVLEFIVNLPKAFKNISNFHNLPEEEIRKYDIYPVEDVKDSYDPMTQRLLDDYEVSFNGDVVIRRWRAVDLTVEELERRREQLVTREVEKNLPVVAKVLGEIFGQLVANGVLEPQNMDSELVQKFAQLRTALKTPPIPNPPSNPNNPA